VFRAEGAKREEEQRRQAESRGERAEEAGKGDMEKDKRAWLAVRPDEDGTTWPEQRLAYG